MQIKSVSMLAAGLVAMLSASARAQSCAAVFSEMQAKSAAGLKTALTVTTHQANGLSSFSGPGAGLTTVSSEARLVSSGGLMTTTAAGGVKGLVQFSDRSWYSSPYFQWYSAKQDATEPFDVYLSATSLWVYNNKWGCWAYIPNLRCENGLIWGLGTPIGNNNGSNRAVWVLNYSYSAT